MVPSFLQNEIGYGREKTYQKLEKLGEVTPAVIVVLFQLLNV